MENNRFYVYAMYNKNGLFYIGKGTGTRIYNKTKRSKAFLKQVDVEGYYYRKLAVDLSESDAYDLENLIIETVGLNNLVNMLPGGIMSGSGRNMSGLSNPRYGVKLSKETKIKISEARKGLKATKETKEKMSISRCFMYEINGITYNSGIEASKALNVSQSTISRWAKNNINNSKIIKKFYASNNRSKGSIIS